MAFFGFKDKKGPVKVIKHDIPNNNNTETNNINNNPQKNNNHKEPKLEGVISKSLTATTNTKFAKDKRRMGQILDSNSLHSNKRMSLKNDQTEKKKTELELLSSIKNLEHITIEKMQMAEIIDYKNIPDEIIETDEFGFIKNNNSSEEEDSSNSENNNSENKQSIEKTDEKKKVSELLKINARIEKWNYMLQNLREFKNEKLSKLKSRTRKGIPDSIRSYAWQKLCDFDEFYIKDLYQKLDSEPVDKNIESTIIKDLDRTFPNCQFFKDKYGNGQRKLLKVLSNYSKYNKEVGYIQGMSFIVALLLTYMDEESSFFMLHVIIKKYELEGLYLPGFPDLKKKCYVFLKLQKKFIPKIYNILKNDEIYPSAYASEWFICLFSRSLDFRVLVRVFDTFLLEGFKVIYRFSLAFLKLKEKDFIEKCDITDASMITINNCLKNVKTKELFQVAFDFSLSKKYIENCEKEYESIKNDHDNEFIAQL